FEFRRRRARGPRTQGFRPSTATLSRRDELRAPCRGRAANFGGGRMSRLGRLGRGSRILVAVGLAGAVFGVVTAVQAAIPDSKGGVPGGDPVPPQNRNYS